MQIIFFFVFTCQVEKRSHGQLAKEIRATSRSRSKRFRGEKSTDFDTSKVEYH